MIFNPTLQMAFAVSGYSALVLSIVVQTSGMSSGTYGWFKKGEFHYVHRTHLLTMLTTTVFSTSVWTGLLIRYMFAYPHVISLCMKLSSIGVAFYVFQVIWASIREREQHGENLGGKSYRLEVAEAIAQGSKLDEIKKPQRHKEKVFIDWRIYGWIFLGTLLNVTTAVGIGELVCSHLIKYYRSATKTSIAVGTLMQAVSVITQTIFILIFLRDLLILDLACIGILFCAIGGRLAPSILTYRHIEPYVKYFLAFAALSMGGVSSFMVLATVIG
ncbi:MAG: hypothetical protein NPIRA04_24790 [Nitrospirales bacterium]|nr:MAG: hypothetical protein NPIRA04_24790 [Nitrospirales bacterium]